MAATGDPSCSLCPLSRGHTGSGLPPHALPAQKPTSYKFVIVGEGPGQTDETLKRHFSGASGNVLRNVADRVGLPIEQALITNTTKCRSTRYLTDREWKTARACCSGFLEEDLKDVPDGATVISLGKGAIAALANKTSIMNWMGSPIPGAGPFARLSIFPILHPSAVRRQRHYIGIFGKHLQWATLATLGKLPTWKWPEEIVPKYDEKAYIHQNDVVPALERLLAAEDDIVACDTETDGFDYLSVKILNVGLANRELSVCTDYQNLSPRGRELVGMILAQKKIVFHNSAYDVPVLEHAGYAVNLFYDTLLAQKVLNPFSPANLGYTAASDFWASRWKTTFKMLKDNPDGFEAADPTERAIYCARDTWMTRLLVESQDKQFDDDTRRIFAEVMDLNTEAIAMKKRGFLVDTTTQQIHRERLESEIHDLYEEFRRLDENAKPRSPKWLKETFHKYGITSAKLTKTGRESWDEEALAVIQQMPNPPAQLIAKKVIELRGKEKLLSTYVNIDIGADGAVHPTWNPTGAVSGRWSSSGPNGQNIPKHMRDLYRARDGMWLVAADESQLEMRIVALLAGEPVLLKAYSEGRDVHADVCEMIFGKVTPKLRDLTKRVNYGLNYGAGVEKLHATISLDYPDVTMREVRVLVERIRSTLTRIAAYNAANLKDAREKGFVRDPMTGRKYDFFWGLEPTVVANFPVQTGAGKIVNDAFNRVRKEICGTNTHIWAQIHDDITLEGPDPVFSASVLGRCMTTTLEHNGHQMAFTVDFKVGKNWGRMKSAATLAEVQKIVENWTDVQ